MRSKIIFCFFIFFINSIKAVVVMEYDIANARGIYDLPLNPSINQINSSQLKFKGNPDGFDDIGQIGSFGWQIAQDVGFVSPNSQHYYFSVEPVDNQYDFSKSSLSFGASTQFDGNMAIFVNNNFIGNFYLGNNGNFDNYNLSLSSLGIVSEKLEFKLVGWGESDAGFLGLDTGVIPSTFENLSIKDVSVMSAIPEPHQYSLIACLFLLFVVISGRYSNYGR